MQSRFHPTGVLHRTRTKKSVIVPRDNEALCTPGTTMDSWVSAHCRTRRRRGCVTSRETVVTSILRRAKVDDRHSSLRQYLSMYPKSPSSPRECARRQRRLNNSKISSASLYSNPPVHVESGTLALTASSTFWLRRMRWETHTSSQLISIVTVSLLIFGPGPELCRLPTNDGEAVHLRMVADKLPS